MKEFLENKKVLVTGGAGAIGSRLIQMIKDVPGVEIFNIDDFSSGNNIVIEAPNIHFYKDDILNEKTLEEIFSKKIDIIFYLAANFANQNSVEHPEKDLMVNGMGTLRILEYSVKYDVKKIIYSSSSCVYGHQDNAMEEEKITIKLDTPYAIDKLLGEMYCYYFHDIYKTNVTIFRIFNCYGPGEKPGQYRNVIPNFIKLALEGKALPILGNGQETRDFNYIDDVINKMIYVSSLKESKGQTYNLGSGQETQIIDIANEINKQTGNKAGIQYLPRRNWDNILKRNSDIRKLASTGYFEKFSKETSLQDGIAKTIEFVKSLK